MEQFDSSVEESSKVSEQQQRNNEQQCPSCVAELTEASCICLLAPHTVRLNIAAVLGVLHPLYAVPTGQQQGTKSRAA